MSPVPSTAAGNAKKRAVWPLSHTLRQNLGPLRKSFDRHRKEPQGSPRSRGLCRLLPQLVGSFDPGGGVSGVRNAARVGPINSILKKNPGHRKTQGSQIGGHQGKGRSAYELTCLAPISSAASIENAAGDTRPKSIRCEHRTAVIHAVDRDAKVGDPGK